MNPIKFGTDGWRAVIAEDFTVDNVLRVASATAEWIRATQPHSSVVIGYDCRFGSRMFAEWTARMMAYRGVHVYLSDRIVTTPMVSLATRKLGASAGVVITASHNPPSYNGFKIKGYFGGPALPDMIADIEKRIPPHVDRHLPTLTDLCNSGTITIVDIHTPYLHHAQTHLDIENIRQSTMRFAYDAMHGAGQFIMKDLLPEINCHRCTLDPNFGGISPEPIPANVSSLADYLIRHPADTTIITDGDADRIAMMDGNGRFVDSHHIILLLLLYYVKYMGQKGKVAVSFSCSHKIEQFCRKYQLPFEYTKIGFKYLVPYLLEDASNCLIAAEESGGIAVRTHIPERDGIWIGLILWEFMARRQRTLDELIAEVYDEVGTFYFHRESLHLSEHQKQHVMEAVAKGRIRSIGQHSIRKIESLDGYKIWLGPDRWVMIRPSGTEPVLRLYAEGPDRITTNDMLHALREVVLQESK